MSIKLLDRCWRFSTAKGGELLVLLGIADFANDGGIAYPSIATLAKKARLTPRNTQRAIRRLVATRELHIEDGKGPHRVHLYRITLLESPKPEGCQNVMVTKRHGDNSATEGVTFQPYKPSEETVIQTKKRQDDTLSGDGLSGFEQFWTAYPKKEGKGACRKWWKQGKPDAALLGIMLTKIEQAKQTQKWRAENGRFIPMPITWLNQARWEDELNIAAAQNTICERCAPPQQLHEPRKSHDFKYHPKYEG